MANVFKRFIKGILLAGESTVPSDNKNGSIFHHSTDARIKTYIEDAVREIVTNSQNQNLTNKTISAANNTIITAASGNLASTELNAALSELQSDIDTRATQAALAAHINDFSNAHDAAAISFDRLPYTITSNDVQGAIGETWVTLQGHIADSSDAHDASAISVIPSGTLSSTDVQAALQELQTDIDSKATTASNVGTGSGVFKQKTGSTLELKSLSAGSNITITEVGDSIQLSAAGAVINDATVSSKGIVKLAGDLSGTADLPTVPALSSKAPLVSPSFTGTPIAPTAPAGTNTTQIATTAFVQTAVAAGGGGGGSTDITTQLAEFAASNWQEIPSAIVTDATIESMVDGIDEDYQPLLVAVAPSGTNRIFESKNGIAWEAIPSPEQNNWTGIASGYRIFIAVSSNGTNRAMKRDYDYNSNLSVWTSVNVPAHPWSAIAFGNNKFVAVSSEGHVMSSTNGASGTWTVTTPLAGIAWKSITFGNGIFVAVATNYTMTSSDGINWTTNQVLINGSGVNFSRITFGNGLFVSLGSSLISGITYFIFTSTDGVVWTNRSGPIGSVMNSFGKLTFGNGIFIITNSTGSQNYKNIFTSADGITWTGRYYDGPTLTFKAVASLKGKFTIIGYSGGINCVVLNSLRV